MEDVVFRRLKFRGSDPRILRWGLEVQGADVLDVNGYWNTYARFDNKWMYSDYGSGVASDLANFLEREFQRMLANEVVT